MEIRVNGALGPLMTSSFAEDLDVRVETVLNGSVDDDAAVLGLLGRLQNFGLRVVDIHVTSADAHEPDPAH